MLRVRLGLRDVDCEYEYSAGDDDDYEYCEEPERLCHHLANHDPHGTQFGAALVEAQQSHPHEHVDATVHHDGRVAR